MPEVLDWSMMFCTDSRGHPTTALLMRLEEDGTGVYVASEDFGPFDRLSDLNAFMVRAVHNTLGRQPR